MSDGSTLTQAGDKDSQFVPIPRGLFSNNHSEVHFDHDQTGKNNDTIRYPNIRLS